MSFVRLHIVIFFLFLIGFISHAQETIEEIEKKALSHFANEEFLEATPLYLRLLSLQPKNPNYNYRYGTCLLVSSKRKDIAFKYLNFAINTGEVEDEAYYYLGKAYHLTYQFRKAIFYFDKYKQLAGSRAIEKLNVNRQIEMCKNGQILLENLSETLVLKKQEIVLSEFFRIYDLSDIGGELIVTAEFQSKADKKNNHLPLIHFPANSDQIFYSSYGDSEYSGKDIYMRKRLPDKTWSLPLKVLGEVNTDFDEDFPYMHPGGEYLYFCSKGHNSMGGYDVFRSKYDEDNNTFVDTENMDFAISSADDDILYIIDSLDRFAYFASQRDCEAGKVNVYHVRVERMPVQMAIISGTFQSTINPENKGLSISVYSERTTEHIGNFSTSQQGDYLINLPKGGKYLFVLKLEGKDVEYKQVIDVPLTTEFRPFKQKITETIKEGNELLIIENLFDDLFDDPIAILSEVIKKKSEMKVNNNDFDLDSLDRIYEQNKILKDLDLESFSRLEIQQMSQSKVDDLTLRLAKSENRLSQSLESIIISNNKMESLLKISDSLKALAEVTDDDKKRANYKISAQKALISAKKQAELIQSGKVIAEFMEADISATKNRLDEANKFNNKLSEINKNSEYEFMELLINNKSFIEDELKQRTIIDAQFEMISEINEEIKQSDETRKRKLELIQENQRLKKELDSLKSELSNAKRKDAELLQQEIDVRENQMYDLRNETKYIEQKMNKLNDAINQQEVLLALKDEFIHEKRTSIEEVMQSVSLNISSIESRINAEQSNIDLSNNNNTEASLDEKNEENINNSDQTKGTELNQLIAEQENSVASNDTDIQTQKINILNKVDQNYA
ncbi:MAG: hypothetical protein P8O07_06475, partial [Crocinitomicaceae bacterium]|nr:hypothetical protein [Crocinitomicaceae bacterium]